GTAEQLERRKRLTVAQTDRLLLDALGALHGPAAQPAFQVVDVRPGETRERRAQERVQVSTTAVLPGEAKQCKQCAPERRLVEPDTALDRIRNAQGAKRRLERGPPALDRGADDCDLLGRDTSAKELEQLLAQ